MSKQMTKRTYHVRRGYLTQGPTLDSLPGRPRDDEPEDDVIEIHNHLDNPDYGASTSEEMSDRDRYNHPMDARRRGRDDEEEEPDDDPELGRVVARFPAGHHAASGPDGSILVYDGVPSSQAQNLAIDRTRARRRSADTRDAPRTLAELNKFMCDYYPRRKATAAR